MLQVKNLDVFVNGKKIISGINLKMQKKQIHAIMGPNGSGKSTFANSLMGNPKYIVNGKIIFNKKNITQLKTDERANLGMFLAFQQPIEIEGLAFSHLLYNLYNIEQKRDTKEKKNTKEKRDTKEKKDIKDFKKKLKENLNVIHKDESFVERDFNVGYSGGERKKAEILQMLLMKPKLAIIDEIDSGLDIDSLKIVANAIRQLSKKGTAVLLITHYARILKYVKPDFVHIMKNGKIVRSGDSRLAYEIEKKGYK